MKFHYSFISFLILLFSSNALFAQEEFVCVWRNPERTMTRIFPDARDYRTVDYRISREQRRAIEERLGSQLLRGQQTQYQNYEMIGNDGVVIGHTIAASQRGEFGAIEFVFGLDTNLVIKGIYIQRTRERNTTFREREFLDLFVGKGIEDIETIEDLYEGESSYGTDAVILGIRKELMTFDEMVLRQEGE
ncbi:hypothetical protein QA601_13315 [Chitinispirillales bacterium ANBcel5]|uniref:hypothetical protein n=1 Tax=Cellulosispirillum alkaliphilum TaxID=3039283 RepID=UPI002A5630EF|nr:hypothetical protein [Chitinispirillales bacterium ANBcel5]